MQSIAFTSSGVGGVHSVAGSSVCLGTWERAGSVFMGISKVMSSALVLFVMYVQIKIDSTVCFVNTLRGVIDPC